MFPTADISQRLSPWYLVPKQDREALVHAGAETTALSVKFCDVGQKQPAWTA